MKKKNVAIIGGGMAGLTCAYLIKRKHQITLFEKSNRLGGNAFMVDLPDGERADIAVAAFGMEGYKEFYALLEELNVKTEACSNTFMSFHNMDSGEGLYLTPSLKGGFRQGFDLFKPKTVKTIFDMFMGIKKAGQLRLEGKLKGKTMRQMLVMIPELHDDGLHIFLGTLCLMSSMECYEVLDTPAEFFVDKLHCHNDVISPKFLYSVRAITGGTQSYIKKMAQVVSANVVLNSKIKIVKRTKSEVTVVMENGDAQTFDDVIFACNADQALNLIEQPTELERRCLSAWKYKEGRIVVHKDHSAFPSKDLIQAYTYLYHPSAKDVMSTSVNGALWFEPYVSDDCDYISSQHPNFTIRQDLVAFDGVFRTPLFNFDSIATQKELPNLNGQMHSYFCGSHFGFGLHNDAVTSAYAVAQSFGVQGPVQAENSMGAKGLLKMASKLWA